MYSKPQVNHKTLIAVNPILKNRKIFLHVIVRYKIFQKLLKMMILSFIYILKTIHNGDFIELFYFKRTLVHV